MPSLGADMDAGTVSKWMVAPGDAVRRGDIVAVVETEKSTIEVEIFESGTIEDIVVPEGERVPVGTVLATVRAPQVPPAPPAGERPRSRTQRAAGAPSTAPEPAVPSSAPDVTAAATGPDGAVASRRPLVVSPVVRHLAAELGVDLDTVAGTGGGGLVTRADVEHAARPGSRRRSSPRARRLGEEFGVDLTSLVGTGPGGAVTGDDVRRAASAGAGGAAARAHPTTRTVPAATAPESGAPSTEERQLAMRHAIGALMARSKREIPHYYLRTVVDMSRAAAWLEQANLERPVTGRLVMPVLMLKAVALAVAEVPEMNGFMVGDRFEPSTAAHVGVAVSLRTGGVIAPAIHDVGTLGLDDVMTRLRDLVVRARGGVLRSSEMSDPTITVTNLGDLGVDEVFGVIYPPQVALVGFGRVAERPWATGGLLGVRRCVSVTLSADHRASDGHRGGIFLATIDRLLQRPEEL